MSRKRNVRHVLITGDTRRGGRKNQAQNIDDLYYTVAPALLALGATVTIEATPEHLPPEEWAWTDRPNTPLTDIQRWPIDAWSSGVIGFELPLNLMAALIANGVPFMDVIHHPFRKTRKRLFGILRNYGGQTYLGAASLGEVYSQYHSSQQWRSGEKHLAVGQTREDRSLVVDGKFVSILDYVDELPAGCPFRPHPLDPDWLVEEMKALGHPTVDPSEDIYPLLGEATDVWGVSSSCLYEAELLGATPHFFAERPLTRLYEPVWEPGLLRAAAEMLFL